MRRAKVIFVLWCLLALAALRTRSIWPSLFSAALMNLILVA